MSFLNHILDAMSMFLILQLAEVVTKWPVVLLPSHRSYLDFILISYIMFEHDIVLPCIAAGQGVKLFMHCVFLHLKISHRFYVNEGGQSSPSPQWGFFLA